LEGNELIGVQIKRHANWKTIEAEGREFVTLVYCLSNGFTTGHLLGDIFRLLCSNKGLGVLVVKPDVLFDGGYQFRHAFEYSPANSFPCGFSEPTFNQIQP
jgi:hypothetical protein